MIVHLLLKKLAISQLKKSNGGGSLVTCERGTPASLKLGELYGSCYHRLISRDRPTKTGSLCLWSTFFYVAALSVRI